jgi:peptidoglycan/LPS O-acetylase OafA/YrhL
MGHYRMPISKSSHPLRTIDSALAGKNNFDALRFLAALGVVFSHAYPVTQGSNAGEVMSLLSDGKYTIGGICVMVFFVISGFLITQSFARCSSAINFMTNRLLRIVPALAVMAILMSFVVGPIVTTLSPEAYWTSHATYRFLGNGLVYTAAQRLPGVFEHLVYPNVVNASIWTLYYEFSCYTFVAAVGLLFRKDWIPAGLMLAFSVASVFMTWISPRLFLVFGAYFLAGSLVFLWRRRIPLDRRWFAIAALTLVVTLLLKQGFDAALLVCGTYCLFWIAFQPALRLHDFARHGDLSYGVYIYAFPIQQLLSPLTMSPAWNFIASTPLILLCAGLSWHFVEKPALSYKQRASSWLSALTARG